MTIYKKVIVKSKKGVDFEIESAVKSDAESLLLFGQTMAKVMSFKLCSQMNFELPLMMNISLLMDMLLVRINLH